MGELFRRFWLPALLPSELPTPDSDPIRFRILGEDLIAFRDTNGNVGFIANNCPHRGASLFFGRNEEAGLRCVYHGWKFDVDGQLRRHAQRARRVRLQSTRSRPSPIRPPSTAASIWIYMGPPDKQPPLPQLPVVHPPGRRPDHGRQVDAGVELRPGARRQHRLVPRRLPAPTFDHPTFRGGGRLESTQQVTATRETDFGFVYGARRDTPDGQYYWRVTTYAMPTFTQIASQSRAGNGIFVIPRDDESHWWITVGRRRLPDEPRRGLTRRSSGHARTARPSPIRPTLA